MPETVKATVKNAVYLLLFYLSVKYALPIIAPFIIGLSVAAMVQKPAALLSKRIPKLSFKTSSLILTFAVIFCAFIVVYFAFCSVLNGAMSFCPSIPEHLSRVRQFISEASAGSEDDAAWKRFVSFVASGANWCMEFFTENYRDYLPSLLRRSTGVISGLPSLVTASVFAVLSALFGCGDLQGIKAGIKRLLPDEAVGRASVIINTLITTITALLKAYGIIMLITFAELLLGLGIMNLTGHPTGSIVSIALVIALIDILPVLGTGTVLIPWGIFEIVSGRIVSGAMLLAIFAVVETVRNLIEPKLIGSKLELHPFFTLTGVYIGWKIFGPTGIFIMPLAIMVLRQLHGQKNRAAERSVTPRLE